MSVSIEKMANIASIDQELAHKSTCESANLQLPPGNLQKRNSSQKVQSCRRTILNLKTFLRSNPGLLIPSFVSVFLINLKLHRN